MLLIAARAAGLLQVVLKRAGNVAVDHQPDIGFVDPHAKCVGGGDHPQFADTETFLDLSLFVGFKAGVKVFGRKTLLLEELRNPFCHAARCAIDHRARGPLARQLGLDHAEDFGQLGFTLGCVHLEGQVGADSATVEQQEIDLKSRLEMLSDIAHDLRACFKMI